MKFQTSSVTLEWTKDIKLFKIVAWFNTQLYSPKADNTTVKMVLGPGKRLTCACRIGAWEGWSLWVTAVR